MGPHAVEDRLGVAPFEGAKRPFPSPAGPPSTSVRVTVRPSHISMTTCAVLRTIGRSLDALSIGTSVHAI